MITPEIRQKIQFLGTEPIKTVAEDTPDNWAALGTGVAGYGATGTVTDKPTTHGILINNIYYGTVTQIWQGSGANGMWFRRGSGTAWTSSWIKVLDENNGITKKKLWSNGSPTSNFAGQTLTVSGLSGYDDYEIEVGLHTSLTNDDKFGSRVGRGMLLHMNNGTYVFGRSVTVSGDKVTFASCTKMAISGTATSTDNSYLIPIAIYGVKGVQ